MVEFSWTDWHAHPSVIVALVVMVASYLLIVGPIRERYGLAKRVSSTKIISFLSGSFIFLIALISPLHELGDNYLFSAHMIQHLLLILIAPPLILMGTPSWLLAPITKPKLIKTIALLLTKPVFAFLLFNGIFAMWHVPAMYNLTLEIRAVHIIEHLMFIASGFVLWWPVLSPIPDVPRSPYLIQTVYLFLQPTIPAILGAFIAFSDGIIYSGYTMAPRIWGISIESDQQLGGLIMWVPGGLVFLLAVILVFLFWAKQEETRNLLPTAQR